MKANYKVVNNRQAQLKKVIQNFEPTGVCAFLMFRYYVMQLMAESEAAGGLNVPLSDSAELRVSDNVDGFFSSAKDEAVSNYLDPDDESKDVIIHFDGTPEEFSKELESYILVARLATLSTHSSIFRMSLVSAVGTSSWLSQNLCPNTNRQKERSTAFVTTNMRSDEL